MSLRIDERRGGRSRSRSRSRDDRAPSPGPGAPPPPPSETSSSKRKSERRTVQILDEPEKGEAQVEERRPSAQPDRYAPSSNPAEAGVREEEAHDETASRRNVIPGLSSLAGAAGVGAGLGLSSTQTGTSRLERDAEDLYQRAPPRDDDYYRRAPPNEVEDEYRRAARRQDDQDYYRTAPRRKDDPNDNYSKPGHRRKDSEPQYAVRAPRGVEMPLPPGWHDDPYNMPGAFSPTGPPPPSTIQGHPRAASFAVPYPVAEAAVTSPRERSMSFTQMPRADYASSAQYHYPSPPSQHNPTFAARPSYGDAPMSPASRDPGLKRQASPPTSRHPSYSGYSTEIREAKPSRESKTASPPTREARPHRLSVTGERGSERRGLSPGRLGLEHLAVGGAVAHGLSSNGAPPASPLLEAYHGTYQTASPMPSPMMLPSNEEAEELPPLALSDSNATNNSRASTKKEIKTVTIAEVKPKKKTVTIYDAEKDARILASAMSHSTTDTGPLIDILPELSHDQLLELRTEYKKHCKVQGRGVNIAKHIKVKTTGNFGKICYVTALGRWESEAYWANFWYQSHSSNRELLIEALMGRTNAEIRSIKDSFKDKRYNDSLAKCMEKELKADKFRTAILLALDERRQEETDVLPLEARNRDVDVLHRALTAREGGESAILAIVVTRSDAHLRDVLKAYEREYGDNFARAALKKSNNLVGEVIAHILNGAINRPARDTLLLRHAINDITARNKDNELRYELLSSRLVRLHWDRTQLRRVKQEYERKYGVTLENDVLQATRGDYSEFCARLCEG